MSFDDLWMPTARRMVLASGAGAMVLGFQLRPTTMSSIYLNGLGRDEPRIETRFLESDYDRDVTSRFAECARELMSANPIAQMVTEEVWPGPAVQTRDDVLEHARRTGNMIHHAVGSVAMGPDDFDPVDGRLRVRGVEGLRVVDASVFPRMIAGNTVAPVMALAWRAAKLIQDDR